MCRHFRAHVSSFHISAEAPSRSFTRARRRDCLGSPITAMSDHAIHPASIPMREHQMSLTAVALHLRHASSSFAFLALFSSQHAWCEKARGDLLSGKGILAYGPMERVDEEVHSEESVYQLHVVLCAFQAPFLCLCLLICGCALLLLLLSIRGWLCARGCTPAGGKSTNGRCQCNALRKTLIACVMAIHD